MRVSLIVSVALGSVCALGCGDDLPSSLASSGLGSTSGSTGSSGAIDSSSSGSAPDDTRATGDGTGSSSSGATGEGADGESSESSSGDDSGAEPACESPLQLVPCDAPTDSPEPLQAMELGCVGPADATVPLSFATFASADPDAWRVARRLGTHDDEETGEPTWGPTQGEQLLILSTGTLPPTDELGAVTMDVLVEDANDNPDDKPLPAPMTAAFGGGFEPFVDCDGTGDCSNTLWNEWLGGGSAAYDLVWFQFRTEVPSGTYGFAFDAALFSEEFPESVGTVFNDMLVVWSSSESYVGNLCVPEGEACSVGAQWPVPFHENSAELAGTGFSAHEFDEGGGTGWFRVEGSSVPHEQLELTVALFDMGDDQRDTLVLLDGFGWDCEGCSASPDDRCRGSR
ncbi:MAG: hypothetical protein AAF799_02010 [Myxococcota bacterium]